MKVLEGQNCPFEITKKNHCVAVSRNYRLALFGCIFLNV